MAALRKMLGSATHPTVIRLMRLMETQSHRTLIRFAAGEAARYLPLTGPCGACTAAVAAVAAVECYLAGTEAVKGVKAAVADARKAAQAEKDPVRQAAMRAVSTACAAVHTPTCALGFVFYGAAAHAYHTAGVAAAREEHDVLADAELARLYDRLTGMAVQNEPDPVRIDWGC